MIGGKGRWFAVYGVVIAIALLLFFRLPTAFLPDEDQGLMLVQVQTAPGATLERTQKVLDDVSDYLRTTEHSIVDATFEIGGFNFAGRGQNSGLVFIKLKNWDSRKSASDKVNALMTRISGRFALYKNAVIIPINPPPVPELGTAAGFDFELEDVGGLGHDALMAARNQVIVEGNKNPNLTLVHPNGLDDQPEYKVNVDRGKGQRPGRLSLKSGDRQNLLDCLSLALCQ